MAPKNLLKMNGTRATKPLSVLPERFKNTSCSCSQEMAKEKVQLCFFLRQLINNIGVDALTDMFEGFRIPVSTIKNLFQAEVHTNLISNGKGGGLPKDAQGNTIRTVAPSDFTLVKDEVVEDGKKKANKTVTCKEDAAPKGRIFIDLTSDDE